jgi:AcrR family transcriptional regulator
MDIDKKSKLHKGVSLIFEHFKEREQKLVHALYEHMSVGDIAKLLGVTTKFIYTNYGSKEEFMASKEQK